MIKLEIDYLVIEVTRKCNMACKHCLRGDAQNVNIDLSVIDKLLSQTEHINGITFSGGEPTLNVKAIEYTINKIMEKGIPVSWFWIAINGKRFSQKLIDILFEFRSYCIDTELCELLISQDQFHDRMSDRAYAKYEYIDFIKIETKTLEEENILHVGRAKQNGLGYKDINVDKNICYEIDEGRGVMIIDDYLYINVHGDIFTDCNLSYEVQEHCNIGNIFKDDSISEVIFRNALENAEKYKGEVNYV